jgi:hypothetical protein
MNNSNSSSSSEKHPPPFSSTNSKRTSSRMFINSICIHAYDYSKEWDTSQLTKSSLISFKKIVNINENYY